MLLIFFLLEGGGGGRYFRNLQTPGSEIFLLLLEGGHSYTYTGLLLLELYHTFV